MCVLCCVLQVFKQALHLCSHFLSCRMKSRLFCSMWCCVLVWCGLLQCGSVVLCCGGASSCRVVVCLCCGVILCGVILCCGVPALGRTKLDLSNPYPTRPRPVGLARMQMRVSCNT